VRVVLDSNIAIAAMNRVAAVVERLSKIPSEDVAIPMVAIAELAYGAHRSRRVDQNLGRLAALREEFAAMPVSDALADRYGAVRADLQSRGVTKSDFDLLIACTALEKDALLVTADRGLLDGAIRGLRSENWLERP
jgi:tRNA(fMet)-specific endonuclease VapC